MKVIFSMDTEEENYYFKQGAYISHASPHLYFGLVVKKEVPDIINTLDENKLIESTLPHDTYLRMTSFYKEIVRKS